VVDTSLSGVRVSRELDRLDHEISEKEMRWMELDELA